MITIYHSSNIDNVNWKIYSDNIKKDVVYFPKGSTPIDVTNRLCQVSLFDLQDDNKTNVVYIDNWKLTDETTKQCIRELHSISNPIIFAIESATIKNKIFSELKIETVKATAVTKKVKQQTIHQLLSSAKIKLDPETEELLVNLLPDKIDFIRNEIHKLQLLGQTTFNANEIKAIIFDMGDATIFNITDSWLKGDQTQTIERLNDLIAQNITIQSFIPVFALKLIQIKLFLTAKLAKWSTEIITAKQGIPFWQQRLYSDLRPYDKNLEKIDEMLDQLYQFDINVKKQRNIPYTQLIKILFK